MKLKHLNVCILAIGSLLLATTACNQQPWLSPFLSVSHPVSSDTIRFDAFGGETHFLIEASRDWYVEEVPSWVLLEPESGKASVEPVLISVSIPENVGYDRIAELVFIAGPSMEFVYLYQEGPEGHDDGIIDITCAEFSALPDNDGNVYRLKGSVSGSINTTYGNFDVTDATGTVYVYGCTNIEAYKSQLKSGALITVTGPKTTYNGKVEMKNATIEEITEGEVIRPTDITDISCAAFNQLTDTEGWYRLTGVVSGSVNTTYGNFDVTDQTGSVYVYGCDNIADHAGIAAGDSIAVVGHYYLYTNPSSGATKVEMMNGYIEWYKAGSGAPPVSGPDSTTVVRATVQEFLAAQPGDGKWYELTGVVVSIANVTYGNLDLKDETGQVYVYGVCSSYVPTNDKSFNKLGLNVTDTLTIWTMRSEYGGSPQAGGTVPAVYVSHSAGAGLPTTYTHDLTSNLAWTLVTKGTESNVIVDGASYPAFKIGTASLTGKATVTVPAGSSKIGFYALGWTGVDGKLTVSGGNFSQAVTAVKNTGCNNSTPYTITNLTDSDWYSLSFGGPLNEDTVFTFETAAGGCRAIIFGINAE